MNIKEYLTPGNIFDGLLLCVSFLYVFGVAYSLFSGYPGNHLEHYPWYIFNVFLFDTIDIKALGLSFFGSLGLFIIIVSTLIYSGKNSNLYGNAHWASLREITKMGLFAKNGILLGKYFTKYLCIAGDKHVLLYGPTESGKGVGFVIPNLLNWRDSIVVLDIKKENYAKTSGFRAKYGQQVFLWDPATPDGKTWCYNPLAVIPKDSITRINDIQKIAVIMWPPEKDKGDIWNPGARSLFTGLVLYQLDFLECPTFGKILREVSSTPNFSERLNDIMANHYDELDRLCIENFNVFLQTPEKTRGGIQSQLITGLSLWENPVIDAATSRSDFDLRELRKKRISIYVGVNPGDLKRLAPLLNLFFQQLVDLTVQEMPAKNDHQVLMCLDEFTSLGYMSVFESANAYIRAYKLLMMVVIQDLTQFYVTYKRDPGNVIINNFKVQVAYPQNSDETATKISKRLGTKTVKNYSNSHSGGKGVSVNSSQAKRELMMPHEIMSMNKSRSIIMVEGESPIKAKKIKYYTDNNFKSRILDPVSIPTIDLDSFIRKIPRPVKPDFEISENMQENHTGSNAPAMSDEELESLMGVIDGQ